MKTSTIFLLLGLLPILTLRGQDVTWDTITFENPYEYLSIDTSSTCIWQIDVPQKAFFDAAYSGERAIVTDPLNPYPINNNSCFDLKIGIFNIGWYPEDIFIEFRHKFDTDSLHDGGFITISYDTGRTFINIIEDTNYFYSITPVEQGWLNANLYSPADTLYNGEYGYSGRSDGWITTNICWTLIPIKADYRETGDTIILRFNFISDNNESDNEGWMLDNIRLYSVDFGGAVHDFGLENLITIYPNPVNSPFTVKLDKYYSDITIDLLDVKGNVLKQSYFHNTDSLEYGYTEKLKGIYFLKITLNVEKYVIKKLVF